MNNERLIVLMGLPRSGKSTWARANSRKLNAPIVNPDAIRLAMYGTAYIRSMEPYVWAVAKTMVDALFRAGQWAVIVDATNATRAARDKWRDMGWDVEFHYIAEYTSVCINRAKEPGANHELVPVIERMAAQFEALQQDEKAYTP